MSGTLPSYEVLSQMNVTMLQDAIFSVFGNGMSSVMNRLVISPYTYIGISTG